MRVQIQLAINGISDRKLSKTKTKICLNYNYFYAFKGAKTLKYLEKTNRESLVKGEITEVYLTSVDPPIVLYSTF